MTGLEKIFDLANLRRAYRWIMSNPDAQYKSYFRDSYNAFAIASDTHLKWIRAEGLKERYQVSHASKILVPKPSGALRLITLLTVEDQIVYQACVNLIADALKPKTVRRYERRVFAHLYAGKSSQFFYYKWQRSYLKFSQRVRDGYSKGYEYIANFDLASFYDSIDHHVLRHHLKKTGVDEDTIEFLLECLKFWTSSTWSNGPQNIYHEHGIPQGPLASGMLSEAVLQHLDDAGEQGRKSIYLRYVDDIKILAKNEKELRRKLIKLDISSKEIGLFPQTAKINIRRIEDPNEEVKSVSRPHEEALSSLNFEIDQKKLILRIKELSRNGKIEAKNVTRFKYLLSHANPTHHLNSRVIRVLERHPELAPNICRYISAYKNMPSKLSSEIFQYLEEQELYHSVNGLLLRACLGRFSSNDAATLGRRCVDRLIRPVTGSIRLQPSYKEALIAWGLKSNTINFSEYEKIVFNESDWWIKKCALRELSQANYGAPTYADFINRFLRTSEGETARIAASRLLQDGVALTKPYGDVEVTAKQILKAAKVIRVVGQPISRINEILEYLLKRKHTAYNWKIFFGTDHRQAELMMLFLKRNRESNIDAFLVQLDSYCDLLIRKIYVRFKPRKTCPSFGHVIKDHVLINALPVAMDCFANLHKLRLESTTAHPKSQKTGKHTRRLKHYDFYKIRPKLIAAFDEIETNIVL